MATDIYHIAIDGPVAGGKGTVAKLLSTELGIPCLDTGAIYRGIAVAERDKLSRNITAKIINNITRIYIDNKDITTKLRENDISKLSSNLATNPEVRALCTKISQDLAGKQSLIAEGRDICSVVLPNAKHKFYLTAHVKVRANRRHADLVARGEEVPLKQVLHETKYRDRQDIKKGGLVRTSDAILIDSTKEQPQQTTQRILEIIRANAGA